MRELVSISTLSLIFVSTVEPDFLLSHLPVYLFLLGFHLVVRQLGYGNASYKFLTDLSTEFSRNFYFSVSQAH
jgi:hypothetical protein